MASPVTQGRDWFHGFHDLEETFPLTHLGVINRRTTHRFVSVDQNAGHGPDMSRTGADLHMDDVDGDDAVGTR